MKVLNKIKALPMTVVRTLVPVLRVGEIIAYSRKSAWLRILACSVLIAGLIFSLNFYSGQHIEENADGVDWLATLNLAIGIPVMLLSIAAFTALVLTPILAGIDKYLKKIEPRIGYEPLVRYQMLVLYAVITCIIAFRIVEQVIMVSLGRSGQVISDPVLMGYANILLPLMIFIAIGKHIAQAEIKAKEEK